MTEETCRELLAMPKLGPQGTSKDPRNPILAHEEASVNSMVRHSNRRLKSAKEERPRHSRPVVAHDVAVAAILALVHR